MAWLRQALLLPQPSWEPLRHPLRLQVDRGSPTTTITTMPARHLRLPPTHNTSSWCPCIWWPPALPRCPPTSHHHQPAFPCGSCGPRRLRPARHRRSSNPWWATLSAQLHHLSCPHSIHCRPSSLPSSHWFRVWRRGLLWPPMRELVVPHWLDPHHLLWACRPVAWPKAPHPSWGHTTRLRHLLETVRVQKGQ